MPCAPARPIALSLALRVWVGYATRLAEFANEALGSRRHAFPSRIGCYRPLVKSIRPEAHARQFDKQPQHATDIEAESVERPPAGEFLVDQHPVDRLRCANLLEATPHPRVVRCAIERPGGDLSRPIEENDRLAVSFAFEELRGAFRRQHRAIGRKKRGAPASK